jgi:dTDP-4-dehydrorhamnose reductase
MITILVTGSNGQLGSELRDMAAEYPDYRFLFTDIGELDITDTSQVSAFFAREQPDVVINCAAYTAVDKAEDDEETALLLNAAAPGLLAAECSLRNGFFVHISTDYIFNGNAKTPIREEDPPDPRSAYGRTKLEGERRVAANTHHGLIIRTSWLYSSYGHNFVKTILRYGREKVELNVVNDQRGTPTYARDLARTILTILAKKDKVSGLETFNFSNGGETTWYEFAVTLLALKNVDCRVNAVGTKDYPTKAARPQYSVLSKEKIVSRFGIVIPDWKESLAECLDKID